MHELHGTTILSIRRGNSVVIAGDGQVTLGNCVMKSNACKVREICSSKSSSRIICGFAGATADAFALCERLSGKLEEHPGQLLRACVELVKDWRTDRYLRRLEAMMIVADISCTLIVSGTGDVIDPKDGIAAIGSGGNYALAAARALMDSDMDIEAIAKKSMEIAADICIYTNNNIIIEKIEEQHDK